MKFLLLCVLLVVGWNSLAMAAPRELVRESFRVEKNVAYVQLRVENLFTQDIVDAITSGLTMDYILDIQVHRKRTLWFNAHEQTIQVHKTITYDAMRRVYLVTTTKGNVSNTAEYRDQLRAFSNFQNSTMISIPDFSPGHYLVARAYLKEFSHWFPLNLIVHTFADWEFNTPSLTLENGSGSR